jgi:N-terminal domain of anti-restriction factor ArdC
MSKRSRVSDAEREQRRAADRQRLQQAAEQLLSSEGWQRWVRTRATNGLARYSINNQLLIALQTGGTATFVAGFRAWLNLGYAVRKGEPAIRIVAPMPIKQPDEQPADAPGEERDESHRLLYRCVAVFDRRQVSPIDGVDPAPLEPPSQTLTGDSHGHLLERLERFAGELSRHLEAVTPDPFITECPDHARLAPDQARLAAQENCDAQAGAFHKLD